MHKMQAHNSQLVWRSNRRGAKLGLYGEWVLFLLPLCISCTDIFSRRILDRWSLWPAFTEGHLVICLFLWCLSQPLKDHLDVGKSSWYCPLPLFNCTPLGVPIVPPKEFWFDVLCRFSTSSFWGIPSMPEGRCCQVFFTIFLASSWILNVTVTYPCLTTLCHL